MANFKEFFNLRSLSKTLRFKLLPIGKTLDNIRNFDIIGKDKILSKNFRKIKSIITEYHKHFIKIVTEDFSSISENLSKDNLEKYEKLFFIEKKKRTEEEEKELNELNKYLVKSVSNLFQKSKNSSISHIFKNIFKKEIIETILPEYVENHTEELTKTLIKNKKIDENDILIDIINVFYKNFTYLKDIQVAMENIYGEKESSIAHRVIKVNLPKFLKNKKLFESIKEKHTDFDWTKIEIDFPNNKNVFSLDYYSNLLLQKNINDYNTIIGGFKNNGKIQIKGLNNYISLYNDSHKDNKIKGFFTTLDKQILSDEVKLSFILDNFDNLQSLLNNINDYLSNLIINGDNDDILKRTNNIFQNNGEIFIRNGENIKFLSYHLYNGEYDLIKQSFIDKKLREHNGIKITEKIIRNINKTIKESKYFSLDEISDALDVYFNDVSGTNKELILNYYKNAIKTKTNEIHINYKKYKETNFIDESNKDKKKLSSDENEIIEKLLISIKSLFKIINVFHVNVESDLEINKIQNNNFYDSYSSIYDYLLYQEELYEKVKNFLTKKQTDVKKLKLNFDHATLLGGFDNNKIRDNGAVIFRKFNIRRKDYDYFLGILSTESNKNNFNNIPIIADNDFYEKMYFKNIGDIYKQLPRIFFSDKSINEFKPSDEILRIKNSNSFTEKGKPQNGFEKAEFNIEDCRKIINYYKNCIKNYELWKEYDIQFDDNKIYNNIDEFFNDIYLQSYKLSFNQKISNQYIDNLIDTGEMFLFQIYNKDFSENKISGGNDNLHTMYFKMLFDQINQQNMNYKLNGGGEIFFREQSKFYDEEHKENGYHHKELVEKYGSKKYPIFKDKRYSEDSFLLHIPISINSNSTDDININDKVLDYIKNNKVNIIGIDRGERNLLVITIRDYNGNIIETMNLNGFYDKHTDKYFDYNKKLDEITISRKISQQKWGEQQQIKNIKKGYISNAVNTIVKLVIEHNAIIVMENLNFGFKKMRSHIDKQIYQAIEKALIEKLSYLVIKNKNNNDTGSLLKAYQLCERVDNYKDMKNQNGIIFFVNGDYTSKIDPTTGFIKALYTNYKNIDNSIEFFKTFDNIQYNFMKDWFEFKYDSNNFKTKKNEIKDYKTNWVVCTTNVNRFVYNKNKSGTNNKGGYEKYNITNELKELFEKNNIDFSSEKNLISQICDKNNSADFFKTLYKLLHNTIRLRYSNSDNDNIISPVMNNNGYFFNTQDVNTKSKLPKDSDEVGSYCISLKGLMFIQDLKNTNTLNLNITNDDWIKYIQKYNGIIK